MEFCKNEANKPRSLELPAFIEKPARVKLVDQFTRTNVCRGGPEKTVVVCCATGPRLEGPIQSHGRLFISQHHPTSPGLGTWG